MNCTYRLYMLQQSSISEIVWRFIGVYIINNRTLHGCWEMKYEISLLVLHWKTFNSLTVLILKYFSTSTQRANFVSLQGFVIKLLSSILLLRAVIKISSCRLMIQVGREFNSKGICLFLFFFYFPTKVGGGQVHNSPPPLMTALLLQVFYLQYNPHTTNRHVQCT